MSPLLLLALIGCRADDPGPATAPSAIPPRDTGPLPPLVDDCRVRPDNGLRVDCVFHRDAPTELVLDLLPDDGTRSRRFHSPRGTDHALVAWGLRPVTAYRWEARDPEGVVRFEGTVETGAPPPELDLVASTWGDDPRVDAVLVAPSCLEGYLVLFDADGALLWYEDVRPLLGLPDDDGQRGMGGFRPDGDTIWATYDQEHLFGLRFDGELVLHLRDGADFEGPLHHDLFHRDGRIWALWAGTWTEPSGVDVIYDGLYVFDTSGGLLATWSSVGVWDPGDALLPSVGYWTSRFPAAYDFTHANGVYVTEAGDAYVSFRHLSTVIRLRAEPGAPDFGLVEWELVGSPGSVVTGDFAMIDAGADAAFSGQHDPTLLPDGRLMVFDNDLNGDADSRVVQLEIDEQAMEARAVIDWDLGRSCPIQGSAQELDDGHVLVTCASSAWIAELAPGRADPVWEADLSCVTTPTSVARAMPVDLPRAE